MAAETHTESRRGAFQVLRRLVKVTAVVVGGTVSLLCLAALGRSLVESLWIRLAIAASLLLVVSLVVIDRVLPRDDPARGRGLPTDVIAIGWMGLALVLSVALRSVTSPLLAADARALAAEEHTLLARGISLVAGASVEASHAPSPTPEPVVVASAPPTSIAPEPDGGRPEAPADAGAEAPPVVAARDLSPAEVFQRWAPSVVFVQAGEGSGTGFVVSPDGLVATNSHVVHGRRIGVKLMDGTWASEVWLVDEDEQRDLALLRIRTHARLVPVVLADADSVTIGETAISIGNPLGLEHTLTEGIVSSRRVYEGQPMIQMSTPVSPGNSGGPLFNARGEVIGVTTAQIGSWSRAQNLNLAVPSDQLVELMQADHPEPRQVGRGGSSANGTW